MARHIILLFNLLQDVGVARPLAHLAAAQFSAKLGFLVSDAFLERDRDGRWIRELRELAQRLDAELIVYDSPFAAHAYLQDKQGMLIAASESDLSAHRQTHDVLRAAPSGFLRVTLQHGYECIGFLHNRDHVRAHGARVGFAADILCGWAPAEKLLSISAAERPKLWITGPTMAMQRIDRQARDAPNPGNGGLVCENLHSVRFNADKGRRDLFVEQFHAFSAAMAAQGEPIALRPHPGGQYVLKNGVRLPDNIVIENRPVFRVDLSAFDFGISAPSTILFDMMLAGLPVAVWNDPDGGIDTSNYAGLPEIRTGEDWLDFRRDVARDPSALRARQAAFLDSTAMPLDPLDVQSRFAQLLAGAGSPIRLRHPGPKRRIFIIANAVIPSLSIFFLDPLKRLQDEGRVEIALVTEAILDRAFAEPTGDAAAAWLDAMVEEFAPDIIVGCRYSGPLAAELVTIAKRRGIALLYQLDDDILNIPPEIGESKYRYHNAPERLASVRALIAGADLIYASTPTLRDRIAALDDAAPVACGALSCADDVRRGPARRPSGIIGYMGGRDHGPDLAMIVPAIATLLDRHPDLRFELFSPMAMPEGLARFGERVGRIEPVEGYDAFRQRFVETGWDVGLCPLVDSAFNRCKADIKWVDYTAAGIAVVATSGVVYDEACADGCGLTASDEAGWIAAIEALSTDNDARLAQVRRAQDKLRTRYSPARFEAQLLAMLDRAAGRDLFVAQAAAETR